MFRELHGFSSSVRRMPTRRLASLIVAAGSVFALGSVSQGADIYVDAVPDIVLEDTDRSNSGPASPGLSPGDPLPSSPQSSPGAAWNFTDFHELDLNSDGVVDFELLHRVNGGPSGQIHKSIVRHPQGWDNSDNPSPSNNRVAGQFNPLTFNDYYLDKFSSGDAINSSLNWLDGGEAGPFTELGPNARYQNTNTGWDEFAFGPNDTDGAVGLEFDISGNTHYGWVRIDVSDDPSEHDTLTILDYGYNDTPGAAATVGAGSTVIPEPSAVGLLVLGSMFLASRRRRLSV